MALVLRSVAATPGSVNGTERRPSLTQCHGSATRQRTPRTLAGTASPADGVALAASGIGRATEHSSVGQATDGGQPPLGPRLVDHDVVTSTTQLLDRVV